MADERYINESICPDLTPLQVLTLVRIGEEAAEVAKAAAKMLRFGFVARDQVDKFYNNFKDLDAEVKDLNRAYSFLQTHARDHHA